MLTWFLRLALLLQAALAVAQPVLAGAYLTGRFDLIGVHGANGAALLGTTLLSGVAALLVATVGRGPVWPVLSLVLLWFAEGVQIGMGVERRLEVHLPLGVAIVGCSVALAVWSFRPAARRVRPRPANPREAATGMAA